jgi:capsular polysaccharide transport system ATP-binding protein
VIKFEGVHKGYRTRKGERVVLHNLTVTLQSGRSYGILGANGAGKSTLLRMIAGTEPPDSGRIRRDNRISWPLGFGGAFHSAMTARENIRFVARIYGESAKRILDYVQDFAELGEYIDMPVSTYSSGMRARLAFGVSMAISFDCYLVDEITAVGDSRFQKRCFEAFQDMRKHADIIMVSHNLSTVKRYCDTGAILADGSLRVYDDMEEATSRYQGFMLPGMSARAAAEWNGEGDET